MSVRIASKINNRRNIVRHSESARGPLNTTQYNSMSLSSSSPSFNRVLPHLPYTAIPVVVYTGKLKVKLKGAIPETKYSD